MKIKILKAFKSGDWFKPGTIVEVDEQRGKDLIANGLAEKAAAPVENKMAEAPKNKRVKNADAGNGKTTSEG